MKARAKLVGQFLAGMVLLGPPLALILALAGMISGGMVWALLGAFGWNPITGEWASPHILTAFIVVFALCWYTCCVSQAIAERSALGIGAVVGAPTIIVLMIIDGAFS